MVAWAYEVLTTSAAQAMLGNLGLDPSSDELLALQDGGGWGSLGSPSLHTYSQGT